MRRPILVLALATLVVCSPAATTPPPEPFGAVPSARQVAWHELEAYAFVHFTINTFTDKEWGYGDESPELFAPTDFDADALVRTVKEAGLRGLVLTAKHHDGFCLWPSRYTEHSIAHSPYRRGQGDIVREVAEACRRQGIKFGLYLSPWDRNRADYGQPSYLAYYRAQLTELLTNYGPLFEIWFDGANGGDGYYGGAREKRTIDGATYYDWPNTWKIVRELQPQAALFSDAGPDVRWVGNEKGVAGDPCWATINAAGFHPGHAERLENGDRHGAQWIPAEVDVSIRPGWFFHPNEQPKTPAELFSIYLTSVGRGANLILNIAPDRRGRVPEADAAALRAWQAAISTMLAKNLAAGATVTASNVRGGDAAYAPARARDGDNATYWATDDAVRTAELILDLGAARTFDLVALREPITLGQRIDRFAVDAWDAASGVWKEIGAATGIGARRLLPVPATTTTKVRFRMVEAAACPALTEVGLYVQPRFE